MRRALLGIGLLATACVVGVRAEVAFEAEHDLAEVDEVLLALPSTPIRVLGCDAEAPDTCPATLRYDGSWAAIGGTRNDAGDNATAAALVFETDADLGRLRAEVPPDLEGLLDLQFGTAELPDDRDIELRTDHGDLEVTDVAGAVTLDTGRGDLVVRGAGGGLGARTGAGNVTLDVDGHADVETGFGRVDVVQRQTLSDLRVVTGGGSIRVELGGDSDLDLEIRAPGTIRVRTDALGVVGSGEVRRTTGTGVHHVVLVTDDGDVEVSLRP